MSWRHLGHPSSDGCRLHHATTMKAFNAAASPFLAMYAVTLTVIALNELKAFNASAEINDADHYPDLRMFTAAHAVANTPQV
jgi:hypothetical protein